MARRVRLYADAVRLHVHLPWPGAQPIQCRRRGEGPRQVHDVHVYVFLVSCVLCIDVALPLRAAYSKGKVCTPY